MLRKNFKISLAYFLSQHRNIISKSNQTFKVTITHSLLLSANLPPAALQELLSAVLQDSRSRELIIPTLSVAILNKKM